MKLHDDMLVPVWYGGPALPDEEKLCTLPAAEPLLMNYANMASPDAHEKASLPPDDIPMN